MECRGRRVGHLSAAAPAPHCYCRHGDQPGRGGGAGGSRRRERGSEHIAASFYDQL